MGGVYSSFRYFFGRFFACLFDFDYSNLSFGGDKTQKMEKSESRSKLVLYYYLAHTFNKVASSQNKKLFFQRKQLGQIYEALEVFDPFNDIPKDEKMVSAVTVRPLSVFR